MWGEKVDVAGVRRIEGLDEGANHVRVLWANSFTSEGKFQRLKRFHTLISHRFDQLNVLLSEVHKFE